MAVLLCPGSPRVNLHHETVLAYSQTHQEIPPSVAQIEPGAQNKSPLSLQRPGGSGKREKTRVCVCKQDGSRLLLGLQFVCMCARMEKGKQLPVDFTTTITVHRGQRKCSFYTQTLNRTHSVFLMHCPWPCQDVTHTHTHAKKKGNEHFHFFFSSFSTTVEVKVKLNPEWFPTGVTTGWVVRCLMWPESRFFFFLWITWQFHQFMPQKIFKWNYQQQKNQSLVELVI